MSIDKTKLSEVENVYPLKVTPYEQYMGDFKNPSVVTKLNTMITTLHQMGRLTNHTVNQWNTVMKWIVEGGVDEIATEITETKVAAALNEVMKMLDVSLNNGLKDLAEKVSDVKIDELLASGQFESMIQTSLVEINEVVENKLYGFNLQLAEIPKQNLFDISEFMRSIENTFAAPAQMKTYSVKPNVLYTLSSNVPNSSTANLYFNGQSSVNNGVYAGNPVTVNSGANGTIYVAVPYGREFTDGLLSGKYWVKLEEGDKPSAWTPTGGDIQLLKENINGSMLRSDFLRYGETTFPEDFPRKLPFNLYRQVDGRIIHDMDFDSLEERAGHIHLKAYTGSDSNDGLTSETPVRLLNDAIAKANALPESTVIIHLYDNTIDNSRTGGTYSYTLEKNIILKSEAPQGKTVLHTGLRMSAYTWTKEGEVYSAPVTLSQKVGFDVKFKNIRGVPKQLKVVESVSAMTLGTVFYASDKTYVRTQDGRQPDFDIVLMTKIPYQLAFNLNGKRLVMKDIDMMWRGNSNAIRISGAGGAADTSEFWHINCSFSLSDVSNGLATVGVHDVYGFNSTAFQNLADGFNYHENSNAEGGHGFAFEYECHAHDCGTPAQSTSNATTAHDGISILRVGCVGYNVYGPVLADVNGCYSYNIDCTMHDSLRTAGATKAAFYFDESGSVVREGKAYLINCGGGGKDTFTLNSDGNVDLFIQNLKGNNIPVTLKYELVQ